MKEIILNVDGWIKEMDAKNGENEGLKWLYQPFILKQTFISQHNTIHKRHSWNQYIYFQIWNKKLISLFKKICEKYPTKEYDESVEGYLNANFRVSFIIAQKKMRKISSYSDFYTNLVVKDIKVISEEMFNADSDDGWDYFENDNISIPKWERADWYPGKPDYNDDIDLDQQHWLFE